MNMDLNEVPTLPSEHMVNGVKFEETIVGNFDGVVDTVLEDSRIRANEQEQRCKEVEEKQLALELQIRNKHMNLEAIKGEIRVLKGEKLRIEEEIKGLKAKKAALVGGEFSLDENKVLECEKNSALKEVEVWRQKCKELKLRVLEFEGKLKCHGKDDISIGIKGADSVIGSPSCLPGAIGVMPIEGSPDKKYVRTDGTPTKTVHVKRRLSYLNERSCDEIAPPTPAEARLSSASVIDIIDSDNDSNGHSNHMPNSQSEGLPFMTSKHGVQETDEIMDEEEKSGDRENASFIVTPKNKRKRDLTVVTSDDECEDYKFTPNRRSLKIENSDSEGENDDDDNIPISQLRRNCTQGLSQTAVPLNPTRPRRRLVKYGQGELRDKAQDGGNHPGTLTSENVADHESSEDESESSVRSLSSFIVDDSDDEDVEDNMSKEDGGDDSDDVEEDSDSNLNFEEIISRLQSRRNPNSKWISEADMLSEFGKNPELCMKAVCALYRQQTNEEKACKASIVHNGRGFSKFDATRGSFLGEFLTDGVPNGDLVKSVEELQDYHPSGVEECRSLADRYSKQLFNIYENGNDPSFP